MYVRICVYMSVYHVFYLEIHLNLLRSITDIEKFEHFVTIIYISTKISHLLHKVFLISGHSHIFRVYFFSTWFAKPYRLSDVKG